MSWTFFSTELQAGDIIAPQSIGELWSALAERDFDNNITAFTPPIVSNRRDNDDFDGALLSSLLSLRSQYYVLRDSSSLEYENWSNNASDYKTSVDLLYVAATDLGLSAATIDDIHPSIGDLLYGGVRSATYWNIIRKSIQLLNIRLGFYFDGGISTDSQKGEGSGDTWADALSDYTKGLSGVGGLNSWHGVGRWSVSTNRYEIDTRQTNQRPVNDYPNFGDFDGHSATLFWRLYGFLLDSDANNERNWYSFTVSINGNDFTFASPGNPFNEPVTTDLIDGSHFSTIEPTVYDTPGDIPEPGTDPSKSIESRAELPFSAINRVMGEITDFSYA